MKIGIGKSSLWGTWRTSKALADEVMARVLVAQNDDGGPIHAIAVGDQQCHHVGTALALRMSIARVVGTRPENVGVFTTQNHGVPVETPTDLDYHRQTRAFVTATLRAVEKMQPAEMAAVCTVPDPPLTFKRRVQVAGCGAFTFWFGMKQTANGEADFSHLLRSAFSNLCAGNARQVRSNAVRSTTLCEAQLASDLATATVPGKADDTLLQGLFFRSIKGQSLGSVLRFAAHPVTSNVANCDWSSGDYPAYACRRLESIWGGDALFLTGPTGDQCPMVESKSLVLAKNLGSRLADLALEQLAASEFYPVATVCSQSVEVLLTPASAYRMLSSEREAAWQRAKTEFDMACATTKTSPVDRLARLKHLSDEIERLGTAMGHRIEYEAGLDHVVLSTAPYRHSCFVLRLGDVAIAGLPGEPFGSYSSNLRVRTIGNKLMVCEECNGYLGYLPTDSEQHSGGYESNVAFFADAERPLIDAIERALRDCF